MAITAVVCAVCACASHVRVHTPYRESRTGPLMVPCRTPARVPRKSLRKWHSSPLKHLVLGLHLTLFIYSFALSVKHSRLFDVNQHYCNPTGQMLTFGRHPYNLTYGADCNKNDNRKTTLLWKF